MSTTLIRPREERRILRSSEIRARRSGDGNVIVEGYAALYNVWSERLGWFRERISPGAFAGAIQRSDVRFLLNHDGLPLARHRGQPGDTLKLEDRKAGLWIEGTLLEADPDVQRLLPKLERGDLDQMSFAFSLPANREGEEWDERGEERTIVEVEELFDVSAVTFPAYTDTSIAKRSLQAWREVRSLDADDLTARELARLGTREKLAVDAGMPLG